MEKVIVEKLGVNNTERYSVNSYLENGWKVKTVSTASEKDYSFAVFVLEKKE